MIYTRLTGRPALAGSLRLLLPRDTPSPSTPTFTRRHLTFSPVFPPATVLPATGMPATARQRGLGTQTEPELLQGGTAAARHHYQWDLVSTVLLERLPIITPPLNPMEAVMMEMLQSAELEQSMLNDHELRHKQDLERMERKKRGDTSEGEAGEAVITALDMEDAWKKEAGSFVPAGRTTEADNTNNLQSVRRRLDTPLRLLTRLKIGEFQFWDLPWAMREEGETMRGCAERALSLRCGPDLQFSVLGNAPLSFYKYKYPRRYQEERERRGAKVFVFKAYLVADYLATPESGGVSAGHEVEEFRWVTAEEMDALLQPNIMRAVRNIIHTE